MVKKVNKQLWKRQGSKPQIPRQLDMFKGKRHKKVRTALAWQSLNKVNNIWKSDFAEKKRRKLFRATKETILLYRSNTCSLTKREAWVELIQVCYKW